MLGSQVHYVRLSLPLIHKGVEASVGSLGQNTQGKLQAASVTFLEEKKPLYPAPKQGVNF